MHLRQHDLQYFEMVSVPAGTPVIEQIADWKQLREAIINCCNPRTNIDIRALAKLQHLHRLVFRCAPFGDDAFETLGRLHQLRELDMSGASNVKGPGLRHLQKLMHLERLRLQSSANWDASFDLLMSLDHVEYIDLISVRLSESHVRDFEAIDGRDHIDRR